MLKKFISFLIALLLIGTSFTSSVAKYITDNDDFVQKITVSANDNNDNEFRDNDDADNEDMTKTNEDKDNDDADNEDMAKTNEDKDNDDADNEPKES